MSYSVEVPRSILRSVSRLAVKDQLRIRQQLRDLAVEPRPAGCLKMKGQPNQWRIRSGRFRIVYSIFDRELLVEVIDIDDRKDIYRD